MDYLFEFFKQNVDMGKYSTEILSKNYSDPVHQNDPGIYGNTENNYVAEDGSETEICSVETGNSKKNTSNANTAHLSAQVMNLPYNKYNESISDEAPTSPKKSLYDEYDIFKKIREAYAACACNICKCLTGTTITPGIEFCDCEPCKCKDCTLNNNCENFQSSLGNKTFNRIYQIKSEVLVKGATCYCKPCDCIECSQYGVPLRSDFRVENKMEKAARKITEKYPLRLNCPQNWDVTHYTSIDINRLANCKRATFLNDAYGADKTTHGRLAWGEALSKQNDRCGNGSKNYSTSLENKHPATIYQSHSNKKCECSVCECIVCECNANALPVSLNATPYKNIEVRNVGLTNSKFRECATRKCQLCSHKKQTTSQSIKLSDCKCDICSCIQCERDPECKNQDCKCDNGYCETTKYPIKKQLSISRMMRENPLTYECNEYAQLMKCRGQSNCIIPDKTKYGNIYYVPNDKAYKSTTKYSKQAQSTMTENELNIKAVQKDSDKKIDSKKRQRKVTQDDYAMNTATRRPNSQTSKKSMKDINVSILPISISKAVPVTNVGKTCIQLFYPGSRSTQTISISSSSLSRHKNNGYCTHTISLPDTNIVDNFTSTTPESNDYEIRKNKYHNQHDIYLCCEIKKYFNKTNAAKLPSVQQNDNNNRENVVENFLSNTHNTYLTNSSNVEQPKQAQVEHESVHTSLRKAKNFTLYFNKIQNEYESANSEFESVSEELKKSRYIFNTANINMNCQVCGSIINESHGVCNEQQKDTKPNKSFLKNNSCCNSITKHAVAFKVKNNTIKSSNGKETVVERSEMDQSGIAIHNKEKASNDISQPNINTLYENAYSTEKGNEAIITAKDIKESHDSINASSDADDTINRMPPIKSAGANTPPENAANEVELLRAEKILNILKQNMASDIFTERVSSPRSMPKIEATDHFTFNYHTKMLMKSTVPSI